MPAIKGPWPFALLGFAAGTLFGALALGGPGESQPAAEPLPGPERSVQTVAGVEPQSVQEPPSGPGEADTPPALQGSDLAARVDSALAAWRQAETRFGAIQARLDALERRLAEAPAKGAEGVLADRPKPPRTPEERRLVLTQAGVDPGLADDLIWREGRAELDRLELRDRAIREGWMGTDRYREELGRLTGEDRPMREEIGEAAWDRYLYLTGEDNRVQVESVIAGSAAESAGLKAGDLIESYGGERLFSYGELRDATTQGESGELVATRVRRGRATLDIWVPRGPLGVRLGTSRAEPSP